MLTNANITIFHKVYDPKTRLDKLTNIQINNVNWFLKRTVSVGNNGLNGANRLMVRIPLTSVNEELTVSIGDLIVYGSIDKKFSGESEIKRECDDCYLITCIKRNFRGSELVRHWYIEGA